MNYKEAIRERVIKDYLKEYNRVPSCEALDELVSQFNEAYPQVEKSGFSSYFIEKPRFHESSSAEVENRNRGALRADLKICLDEVNELNQRDTESLQSFFSKVNGARKELLALESAIDGLLLVKDISNPFVYSLEETFTDFSKVVDSHNVSIQNGYLTIKKQTLDTIDIGKITINSIAENQILSVNSTTSIDSIKQNDGNIFEYIVYANESSGAVSLIIDISLDEVTYVSDVLLVGSPLAVNNTSTLSVFYSRNAVQFEATPAVEVVLNKETYISVDKELKTIRLLFRKSAADVEIDSKYAYIWAFDLIELLSSTNRKTAQSSSYCELGPYNFGKSFHKLIFEPCIVSGDSTSLDFLISKDQEIWYPVNLSGTGLPYVTFSSEPADDAIDYLTDNLGGLTEIVDDDSDLEVDAYLSKYVTQDYKLDLLKPTVTIKRNVPQETSFNSDPSGWKEIDGRLLTTIYVSNTNGVSVDVGPKGLYLNGSKKTGVTLVPYGYSKVEVTLDNYVEVPNGLLSFEDFRLSDPLFPYNHKYLIEGYAYPTAFVGDKIYVGFDYFEKFLTYVALDEFNQDYNYSNYDIFTIDDNEEDLYFKVKTDKSLSTWTQEQYSVDFVINSNAADDFYVKIIFQSSTAETPILDSFRVRGT